MIEVREYVPAEGSASPFGKWFLALDTSSETADDFYDSGSEKLTKNTYNLMNRTVAVFISKP